jgi:hypothetical protein
MKRPICVTILLWLVLSLTVWSGLRLYSVIRWWNVLDEFASPPGPWYIVISGGIWLMASILLLWGMWQVKAWIRHALLAAGASFAVWYWSDRLLLQTPSANWPFFLVGTFLLLTLVIVCTTHSRTKTFFKQREKDD